MKRLEMSSLNEWLILRMNMSEHRVDVVVALLELRIRSRIERYCPVLQNTTMVGD
jgi:hypothetical protein